jgi:hypothetical protein
MRLYEGERWAVDGWSDAGALQARPGVTGPHVS